VKGISVATILGIKCEEEEYKMREKEVKTNTKRTTGYLQKSCPIL
jgi:hypothetical protein